MNPRSIRFRLASWYALILAVTFAAAGFGVWWAMRRSIHETVDKDLRSRLQAMRTYVVKQSTDPESGSVAEELSEDASLSGTRFRILGSDGHLIYQSPEARQWEMPSLDVSNFPKNGRVQTVLVNGKPIRVLTAQMQLGPKESGTVQIGVPMDEF